jgi:hypothetical protein
MQKRKEKAKHNIAQSPRKAPLGPKYTSQINSEALKAPQQLSNLRNSSMLPAEGENKSFTISKWSENWDRGHLEQKGAREQC